MKNYTIKPSKLSGTISASPSKSHSLRAILFASLATGKSIISNYLPSPDAAAMIQACQLLGANISQNNTQLDIIGVSGKPRLADNVIDAGNSGQVLRFVAAIAALCEGYTIFTGDHSVRYNRPLQPLIEALSQLGAQCISTKNDGYAPLIIKGPIHAGHTSLDGADSQPVSALLIAAILLEGTTEISVRNPGEKPWLALTLAWFDRLGLQYQHSDYQHYVVTGKQSLNGFNYTVVGDFSSIAYPLVAAIITQSTITIDNLDINDAQGDKQLIHALIKMGANIIIDEKNFSLRVKPGNGLHGCELDINDFIDAVTILAVVGCYAQGTTTLTNAAIARNKECDRLATITAELTKMGADIHETSDGLTIHHATLHAADNLTSHHDHRIVMSLVVAALGIPDTADVSSQSTVHDIDCVKKSYPDFLVDMKNLDCNINE
ncbi:MAG: 3-phosphoshikimate 1-carboxyvinyltransferase [Gammaproteobacteria bacterium]|nr:3-phosphoshikimate 1-carboxyvinyltransferase [Gammaproteobacteria bacterium]